MLLQNHWASRLNSRITLNMLTKAPESTGTSTAHRKGTLRAQAEHSISQPTVGSAQTAYTGIAASRASEMVSAWPGPQRSSSGLPPWYMTTALNSTRNTSIVAMAMIVASSGMTIVAETIFDSTVSPSDTGSDFQNRTLRSLRSSYSAPRQ